MIWRRLPTARILTLQRPFGTPDLQASLSTYLLRPLQNARHVTQKPWLHYSLVTHNTCSQCLRFFSSLPTSSDPSRSSRLDAEGLDIEIHDDQLAQIIKRAKEVWPAPSRPLPTGWSSAWENWPHLFTFYWFSPYFLMLPQIEMVVNIMYKIPGETRPVVFSTLEHERELFIFTLVNDPSQFFLYDCGTQQLSKIENVSTEDSLIEKVGEGEKEDEERGFGSLRLELLQPDAEGQSSIERILQRDESVIPLLAEKFLDYTPEPTHPWDESPDAQKEDFTDEEELRHLSKLAEEMKGKLAAAPQSVSSGVKERR